MANIIGTLNPSVNQNDTLNGTIVNDLIAGLQGDDVLDGLAGNDTLAGGTGDDILAGGAGNDLLVGGDNTDTVAGALTIAQYGAFTDLIVGNEPVPNTVNFTFTSGTDPITGAPITSSVPLQTFGSGEVDVIVGGGSTTSSDVIHLGVAGTCFYLGNGNADLAIIVDSDLTGSSRDAFILGGSAANYSTAFLTVDDPTTPGATYSGVGLFYNVTDATGAVVGQDAVAVFVNQVFLNLNDFNFFFQA